MPLITLSGHALHPTTGASTAGATVTVYRLDSSWARTTSAGSTTTDAAGYWQVSGLDTTLTHQGNFEVELVSANLTRILKPRTRAIFDAVIGANGGAPLLDGSITDAQVGSRTITDTTVPTADSGLLGTLLSNIGNMIKSITGKSNWRTAPATTLEATASHIANASNPHATTAAQVGALPTSGGTVSGNLTVSGQLAMGSSNGGLVPGLNADQVDGVHASSFATAGHTHANQPLMYYLTWTGNGATNRDIALTVSPRLLTIMEDGSGTQWQLICDPTVGDTLTSSVIYATSVGDNTGRVDNNISRVYTPSNGTLRVGGGGGSNGLAANFSGKVYRCVYFQ